MAMSLIRSSESHYTSASMYALNHSSAQCLSLPSHQADHLTLCPPLLLWAYPWSYAWKSVERPALCIASATCLKLLMLSCHILKLVNTPIAHLTVKAQVYITGIEGVWRMRTPFVANTYCIETGCLPFGMSFTKSRHWRVFYRPTSWTSFVTHLVHIGT